MSTTTLNRLGYVRQGTFDAANATYPVDLVTEQVHNVAIAADSNTNGVAFNNTYANAEVSVRVVCVADDPPTASVAIYGYVRRVLTTKPNTQTDMDYTGSSVHEIPWEHICTLNYGVAITPATQAVSGVNVCGPTANSFIYTEKIWVGGMYERLRGIPVILTGTNPVLTIDFGLAGGQR